MGALLHDIGHIAAGHTNEDELGLAGRHDSDARLSLVFDSDKYADAEGRTLARLIDELYELYLPPKLKDVAPSEILRLLIRGRATDLSSDPHSVLEGRLQDCNQLRLSVCRDVIGNTICADLLDYLHRDWYHIGKPRPFDERILQYMELRSNPGGGGAGANRCTFVISLGRRPKIRTDAVSAILELLEWRYQLAESVLFHRTKLAAAAMLDRALYELFGEDADSRNIIE